MAALAESHVNVRAACADGVGRWSWGCRAQCIERGRVSSRRRACSSKWLASAAQSVHNHPPHDSSPGPVALQDADVFALAAEAFMNLQPW